MSRAPRPAHDLSTDGLADGLIFWRDGLEREERSHAHENSAEPVVEGHLLPPADLYVRHHATVHACGCLAAIGNADGVSGGESNRGVPSPARGTVSVQRGYEIEGAIGLVDDDVDGSADVLGPARSDVVMEKSRGDVRRHWHVGGDRDYVPPPLPVAGGGRRGDEKATLFLPDGGKREKEDYGQKCAFHYFPNLFRYASIALRMCSPTEMSVRLASSLRRFRSGSGIKLDMRFMCIC